MHYTCTQVEFIAISHSRISQNLVMISMLRQLMDQACIKITLFSTVLDFIHWKIKYISTDGIFPGCLRCGNQDPLKCNTDFAVLVRQQ